MDEKGTSMIETAIAVPLVLALVIGIVTFSFAGYNKVVLTSAAREGAREYAVSQDRAKANKAINDVLSLSVTRPMRLVVMREVGDSVEVTLFSGQRVFARGLTDSPSRIWTFSRAKYKKEGW